MKKVYFKDICLIKHKPSKDFRGYFLRLFCQSTFRYSKRKIVIKQSSIAYTKNIGVIRGLHYQCKPFEEEKIISCVQGSIYNVIVDLRKKSKTYLKWQSFIISEKNKNTLYVPKGFANGYQTLKKNTLVIYHNTTNYNQTKTKGINYFDKKLNIKWPIKKIICTDKDNNWQPL
jgi:dTDP-4-dehydrorhamnose 3,5-epimerase